MDIKTGQQVSRLLPNQRQSKRIQQLFYKYVWAFHHTKVLYKYYIKADFIKFCCRDQSKETFFNYHA